MTVSAQRAKICPKITILEIIRKHFIRKKHFKVGLLKTKTIHKREKRNPTAILKNPPKRHFRP